MQNNSPTISRRREIPDDIPFLKALYASSREREMARLPDWHEEQKSTFLDSQFSAQRTYYQQHYPAAAFDIIVHGDTSIGRIYIDHREQEIILMDITLLGNERGHGIGSEFVRELQSAAEQQKKIVSLHVEDENPARRLYDRLGFIEVGEVTFYKRMHWVPAGLEPLSEQVVSQAQDRTA